MCSELDLVISEVRAKSGDCGISEEELRNLVGWWPFDRQAIDVDSEAALRRVLELLTLTLWIFGETAGTWLRAPNSGLAGRSPLSMMLADRKMVSTLRDVLRSEVDCP